MKSNTTIITLLTLTAVLFTACKEDAKSIETPKEIDYAILKGKVSDSITDLLTINSETEGAVKTLSIAEDRTFNDTIPLDVPAMYMFYDQGEESSFSKLFLYPGAVVEMDVKSRAYKTDISFSSKEQQSIYAYYQSKDSIYNDYQAFLATWFKKPPSTETNNEFLSYLEAREEKSMALLNNAGVPDNYKTLESRIIKYTVLMDFSQLYGELAGKKIQDELIPYYKKIENEFLNLPVNSDDYKTVSIYQMLVFRQYVNKARALSNHKIVDPSIDIANNMKVLSEISNDDVRQKLMEIQLNFAIGDAKDGEKIYEKYKHLITDKDIIANLEQALTNRTKEGAAKKTLNGLPSPKFVNYENYDGSKTSLDDLKGKYVYIDFWATWCGPCKAEIPALKALEKDYHGKNIAFVSISLDKEKAHDTWKAFVKKENLTGIQLFADKDFKSEFAAGYNVNGIPRFVLIDQDGNVIDEDAYRPSNKELRNVLNNLENI